MHSPFAFDFILRVLNNKSCYIAPKEIELLRAGLKKDNTLLFIQDLGAGSRVSSSKQKTIKQLASSAVKPKKYGEVLFRLVKHYQPKTIVELGSSLGVTTASLAMANPSAEVITIEGSEEVYKVANQNFRKLGIKNIQSLNASFDEVLPSVLRQQSSIDIAYIDGNHRFDPTMDYFHQLLEKTTNSSILVFDDIHWSREMEAAWEQIKKHPSVRCTIDIFFLGFVFFRQEFKEKQHFTIRF